MAPAVSMALIRQVLAADTSSGGPDALQNLDRVMGALPTPGLAPVYHCHRRGGKVLRLRQKPSWLLAGMIPVRTGHLDTLVQNRSLVIPRGRLV